VQTKSFVSIKHPETPAFSRHNFRDSRRRFVVKRKTLLFRLRDLSCQNQNRFHIPLRGETKKSIGEREHDFLNSRQSSAAKDETTKHVVEDAHVFSPPNGSYAKKKGINVMQHPTVKNVPTFWVDTPLRR
jgi:hypothetical protein